MIEGWLVAIRDHPERPPSGQSHVLTMLALRVDWQTGRGFASMRMLAADADVTERTAKRATKWGRDFGFVVQTRRGHRITAERSIASEWQLTQGDTGVLLGSQGDNGDDPRGQKDRPKGTPEPHHQESSPSRVLSTKRGNGGKAHKHEPNTRRALATLISERSLPFTDQTLLELAYRVGNGDPWDGYLKVKSATSENFTGARDPAAVLRHRLGIAA